MPIYDFECLECKVRDERHAKIDETKKTCAYCGGEMKRLITSRYNVIGDVEFVTDNITGNPVRVTSRRQLKKLMQENDVVQKYGKGWY